MRPHHLSLSLVLLACASLTACGSTQSRPDPHTITVTTANETLRGRTTLGMPITLTGRSSVVIPFAIESEKDLFQSRDPYASGRFSPASSVSNSLGLTTALSEGDYARSYCFSNSVRWHNAIVHDLTTGEEWPILDRRGVISSWSIVHTRTPAPDDRPQSHMLVFLATLEDTNHDGLLNDLDARVAIITDGDGRHPRIVSPANAQVASIAHDAEKDRLYLLVIADTNQDGKFDFNDSPVPYAVNASGTAATPVVSADMLRRVESLLK